MNEPPIDRLMPMKQVEEMTGLSGRQIYRLVRAGTFPKQFKPGGHASRWSESEVLAWRAAQRP